MPPVTPRGPFPRLDGRYAQHSSFTVAINGVFFYGIPDISGLGDANDAQNVKGLARFPLGQTAGNVEPEDLQLTFFTTDWPAVENVIDPERAGLYDQLVKLHLEITEPGMPIQTRDFLGLRLIKVSESSSQGSEPTKTTATFKPIAMVRNGRNPIQGVDLAAFTANTLLQSNSV